MTTLEAEATFNTAAAEYRRRGWLGTLPLPPRQKASPPMGFTGREAPYPTDANVAGWAQDPRFLHGNLGLHLGPVVLDRSEPFEVLGIDVDGYGVKCGGKQLKELEADLGALPPSATSSARDDGVSGIRFFLVPAGLAWSGKLASNIDVIQKCHRYAVVWPSVHPEGPLYRWYVDGAAPDGQNYSAEIPIVADLPRLPDAWVDFGTRDRTKDEGVPADMDSTPEELSVWAEATLSGYADPPCSTMRAAVRRWRRRIAEDESSHDKVTGAHWNLVCLAVEGHSGLATATAKTERVIVRDTIKTRGKRGVTELRGELFRSYAMALRKAKAQHDRHPGAVVPVCHCDDEEAQRLIDSAFAPGGGWHPDTPKPWETPVSEGEFSSWCGVDIGAALAGVNAQPPVVLARTDGACLFYRGKDHSVHGESESGKSWLVQCAAAEMLLSGEPVLYIDFEDDAGPIAERLIRLGVARAVLTNPDVFVYVRPEATPSQGLELAAFRALLQTPFSLVVIDGVTNSMDLYGLSGKDADDVAKWQRQLPRAFARQTGAAVVCVDHVAKDSQTRGRFALGSQHKMAGLSGAAYLVEPTQPFAVGQAGAASVRVGKDRPGHVRKLGGRWRKADRTQHVANFVLDSTDPDRTTWALEVPENAGGSSDVDATSSTANGSRSTFRPTWFMEQVSRYWEETADPSERTSNKTVAAMCEERKAAGKKQSRDLWRQAIGLLVEESFARAEEGARGGAIHYVAKAYRQDEDPSSDSYSGATDEDVTRFQVGLQKATAGAESGEES